MKGICGTKIYIVAVTTKGQFFWFSRREWTNIRSFEWSFSKIWKRFWLFVLTSTITRIIDEIVCPIPFPAEHSGHVVLCEYASEQINFQNQHRRGPIHLWSAAHLGERSLLLQGTDELSECLQADVWSGGKKENVFLCNFNFFCFFLQFKFFLNYIICFSLFIFRLFFLISLVFVLIPFRCKVEIGLEQPPDGPSLTDLVATLLGNVFKTLIKKADFFDPVGKQRVSRSLVS